MPVGPIHWVNLTKVPPCYKNSLEGPGYENTGVVTEDYSLVEVISSTGASIDHINGKR
jgi:hypothetical protein